MPRQPHTNLDTPRGQFVSTRWSLVRRAAAGPGDAEGEAGSKALRELCAAYWEPLYCYLRRSGLQPEAAMDAVQGFIAGLLERPAIAGAEPERGRFRGYLIGALKHYLASEQRRGRAQKRGGGLTPLSLDAEEVEDRLRLEAVERETPESIFNRTWALEVLEQTMAGLGADYARDGKEVLFTALRPFIRRGTQLISYRELGGQLGMEEGAVKVAVHRLRRRYREKLRGIVAETVETAEQVDEELRFLVECLGA